jgi:hypothetical protein
VLRVAEAAGGRRAERRRSRVARPQRAARPRRRIVQCSPTPACPFCSIQPLNHPALQRFQ